MVGSHNDINALQGLWCLLDLWKDMLHLAIMILMTTNIPNATTLPWYLSKVVDICEENSHSSRSCVISLCYAAGELHEICREGIWRATIFIFYCQVSHSYLVSGRCGRWRILAFACITWSSRVSTGIAPTIIIVWFPGISCHYWSWCACRFCWFSCHARRNPRRRCSYETTKWSRRSCVEAQREFRG
jgi:hypothetical protein